VLVNEFPYQADDFLANSINLFKSAVLAITLHTELH